MSVISAIDLALWDIKGKALGAPVYELLGGRSHDRIRMYANGWPRGGMTPGGLAEEARKVVDQGYTALKFYPFRGEQVATPERIDRGVATVFRISPAVCGDGCAALRPDVSEAGRRGVPA